MPETRLTGQVNRVVLTIDDVGLTGPTDAADAERQLQAAIDLGDLTAQHAPAGHPIYAALDRARSDLESVQDEEAAIGPALIPGTRTYTEISDAIDGIYQASADVRNDPAAELPRTLFSTPKADIPWLEIAAGGGALLLGWWLFKGKRA
jgi:hypothetical protein